MGTQYAKSPALGSSIFQVDNLFKTISYDRPWIHPQNSMLPPNMMFTWCLHIFFYNISSRNRLNERSARQLAIDDLPRRNWSHSVKIWPFFSWWIPTFFWWNFATRGSMYFCYQVTWRQLGEWWSFRQNKKAKALVKYRCETIFWRIKSGS